MKKKIVSKWLHRLPVLLLALILAVMPLSMAAPAHADVLQGNTTYVVELGTLRCIYDYPYDNVLCVVRDSVVSLYCSENPLVVNTGSNGVFVSSSSVLYKGVVFFPSSTTVDFRGVPLELAWSNPEEVNNFVFIVGAGSISGDYPVSVLTPTAYSDVGVLSVFTGVGSWLSGAVQNISTMFWSAETGMTVLGYLAVASLALAVILLIFYLIAGWLKFH